MNRSIHAAAAVLAACAMLSVPANAGAHGSSRCPLPRFGPGASYRPLVDPARFGPHVDNPWFPLPPGVTYVYEGFDSGHSSIDAFAPSRRTRVIDGVRTRVVHDRVYTDGVLSERTSDYYAQDRCGNVWYFGEDTAELDKGGHVTSREGTWHAGVHGAKPGVFMQARPQLHRRFRQEWAPPSAEDQFSVISRGHPVTVPYRHFRDALRTRETTAAEPGVVDRKVYVRGIGEVVERSVRGGHDRLVLVEVLR
jgi:hypothetical protein